MKINFVINDINKVQNNVLCINGMKVEIIF